MIQSFRDLRVYQEAFSASSEIVGLTRSWPRDERFGLSDQIQRSSRSVYGSLAEAWRKRPYPRHFVSKLNDAESEAAETQAWLDSALREAYIDQSTYEHLNARYEHVIAMLIRMQDDATKWCEAVAWIHEPMMPYDVDTAL